VNLMLLFIFNLCVGDKVPADLRLLNSSHLQIDESSLTGESIPVDKNSQILRKPHIHHKTCNILHRNIILTFSSNTNRRQEKYGLHDDHGITRAWTWCSC
jgi:P-type E1-E2 ATPase